MSITLIEFLEKSLTSSTKYLFQPGSLFQDDSLLPVALSPLKSSESTNAGRVIMSSIVGVKLDERQPWFTTVWRDQLRLGKTRIWEGRTGRNLLQYQTTAIKTSLLSPCTTAALFLSAALSWSDFLLEKGTPVRSLRAPVRLATEAEIPRFSHLVLLILPPPSEQLETNIKTHINHPRVGLIHPKRSWILTFFTLVLLPDAKIC